MISLFWVYMVVNTFILFFGILYSCRLKLMPYHEEVIRMRWDELQPEFQILLRAFLAGISIPFIIIALLNYAILLIPFRRGEIWAILVVPVVGIIFSIAGFIVPHYLHKRTGAKTPRLPGAIATVIYVAGFVFSLMYS